MTKINGDRVTSWKIPLFIFTFPNIRFFAMRIVLHLSMLSDRSPIILSANHIKAPLLPLATSVVPYHMLSCNQSNPLKAFYLFLQFCNIVLSISSWSFIPLDSSLQPDCLKCVLEIMTVNLLDKGSDEQFHINSRHAINL